MALSRVVLAWITVAVWLVVWTAVERRGRAEGIPPRRVQLELAGEALVLTLFGTLWFASLGAGGWWLVFALVGILREWPIGGGWHAGLRILRVLVAGGLLAWQLGP